MQDADIGGCAKVSKSFCPGSESLVSWTRPSDNKFDVTARRCLIAYGQPMARTWLEVAGPSMLSCCPALPSMQPRPGMSMCTLCD